MDANLIRLSSAFTFGESFRRKVQNSYALFYISRGSKYLGMRSSNSQYRKLTILGSNSREGFDEAAFEVQRLTLDSKARESMSEEAKRPISSSSSLEDNPKAWKWRIRKRIWDMMEAENIAQNPRPVHHRIPNFVGAAAAAKNDSSLMIVGGLDVFRVANCVKVNPDSPQKQVRFLTLLGGKKLLTPQPRLRTGFFSVLESQMLAPGAINEACTSVGIAKYGRPIYLDEKIKVDLIIIGSVAIDPNTGARLGKGEGFAKLKYGMLRYMGAIDDTTPVVTSVNDRQLVDDIPVKKLLVHDVPVDIICTPIQDPPSLSPSPSSILLPSSFMKKNVLAIVDDSAAKDLRRLLRLD
ncbi:hypothetical protein NE237_029313 [Protea cynaroides]|uniref:5-formyltetrahydrofolate cyclo-ligase n=1 Tax=Protea cynaroides TaxID=273540 RepID=A0A9Q0GSW9_9MAGN|nr:hypothetical protein NE237_029313 [Protea cynaroides]